MNKLITFFFISLLIICQSLYGDVVLGKLSDASWVSAGGNDMVLSFWTVPVTPWELEVVIEAPDVSFNITPTAAVALKIDWGDGSESNYTGSTIVHHTYTNADTYTVALSGSATKLVFGNDVATRGRLKRILTKLDGVSDLTTFFQSFYLCANLNWVPESLFENAEGVTTFEQLFRNSGVTNLPDLVFANNSEITTFRNTLYDCTKLATVSSNIFSGCPKVASFHATFAYNYLFNGPPIGLFDDNTNVTSFYTTFVDNQGLGFTNLPASLFAKCTKVTSFGSTFHGCKYVKEIPPTLFNNNTAATSFIQTFRNCWALVTVPSGLFTNNLNVTSFSGAFYTDYGLKNIETNVFPNSNKAIDFSICFYSCTALTNVPTDLFDSCTNMYKTTGLFQGCAAIVSDVPELWDTAKFGNATLAVEANHLNTFTGCINAGNYADIPDAWKGL